MVLGVADGAGAGNRAVSGLIVRATTAFRATPQGIGASLGFGSGPPVYECAAYR